MTADPTSGRVSSPEACAHGADADRVCTTGQFCSCGCSVCRPTSGRVLTVPVTELQPFDGLHEGSYVASVTFHEVERYDPTTGAVTRQPVVTVDSCKATIVAEEIDGHHLHEMSHEGVDQTTYDATEVVRVARPALITPCPTCGKGYGDV